MFELLLKGRIEAGFISRAPNTYIIHVGEQQMKDVKKHMCGVPELSFVRLDGSCTGDVQRMSSMATAIVREHFDPLIGTAQNDYMLNRFQTPEAVSQQLAQGYRYFFVRQGEKDLGFVAFYPRGEVMYLSKFYLYKDARGRGYARIMMDFVADAARAEGLGQIQLNVNRHNSACQVYERLGFRVIREEQNDIGSGFIMDDYVYALVL